MTAPPEPIPGWDRLSHDGLLLDLARLQDLATFRPERLSDYTAQQLRQRAGAMMEADRRAFVAFVLEQV